MGYVNKYAASTPSNPQLIPIEWTPLPAMAVPPACTNALRKPFTCNPKRLVNGIAPRASMDHSFTPIFSRRKKIPGNWLRLVKQNARLHALDNHSQVVIVDGPPGIGCPVIAAAAGADTGTHRH